MAVLYHLVRQYLDGPGANRGGLDEHILHRIDGVGTAAGCRPHTHIQAVVAPVNGGPVGRGHLQGKIVDAIRLYPGGSGGVRVDQGGP